MEWGGDGDGEREPILPYKDRPVLQNLQDRPLSPCTIPSPFPDAAASAAPGAGLQWIPPRQKKAGRPVQLRRCPRRRRRRPASGAVARTVGPWQNSTCVSAAIAGGRWIERTLYVYVGGHSDKGEGDRGQGERCSRRREGGREKQKVWGWKKGRQRACF